MRSNEKAAKRTLSPAKSRLALAAMFCFGLAAPGAQAQDKLSLPGLLKGAISAPGIGVPSGTPTSSEAKSGVIAEQSRAAAEKTGSASVSAGQGAQGEIVFSAKTLTGKFERDPEASRNHPGSLYGRVVTGGGAGDYLQIDLYDPDGSVVLGLKLMGTVAELAKPSHTYTFKRRRNKDATAEMSYGVYKIACHATAGTVTLTSFGEPGGGTIAGKITDIEWAFESGQPECSQVLGTSASFKVQRAVDFQPFK